MDERIFIIITELKEKVSRKYPLIEIRVFGSSARGDRYVESDIDVFLHLPTVNRDIEEDLFDMAYELELKYDCLIDLIIMSDKDLAGVHAQSFIYKNMIEEGITV